MKRYGVLIALILTSALAADSSEPGDGGTDDKIAKVLDFMFNLQKTVEGDGVAEQKTYHRFACWCEETLRRKKAAIEKGKETAAQLQDEIYTLNGQIGSGSADIQQLKKDIAANIEATQEAEEVRNKQGEAYAAERIEAEQCIGALNAAITALTGAGESSKAGFLSTSSSVQLMSVAVGVGAVLDNKVIQESGISASDLSMVRNFVRHPASFGVSGMSAMQVSNNPFGDYAPQSTQIQGILKGMYDAFAMNLEKANGEESDESKHHQDFKFTKLAELATLQHTLDNAELNQAQWTKKLAEDEKLLEETKKQIKIDEAFFEETKESCKDKAKAWADRSRCRTTELQGLITAQRILSGREENTAGSLGPEGAGPTPNPGAGPTERPPKKQSIPVPMFLQLSSKTISRISKFSNQAMKKFGMKLKSTGHFDKVIAQINNAIERLRAEEQADIDHRDRCEAAEQKNKNDEADAAADKKSAADEKRKLIGEEGTLDDRIRQTGIEIGDQKQAMKDALEDRNEEHIQFKQILQDAFNDKAAVLKAIKALRKFYDEQGIELALTQEIPLEDQEYTIDQDVAPETEFSECGSKAGMSGGVVAILEMIVEDIDNEIKMNRAAEEKALADYRALEADNTKTLESLEDTLRELEERKATNQEDQETAEQDRFAAAKAEGAEQDLKGDLATECDWIRKTWDKRFQMRRAELAAMEDAKNRLAGSCDGVNQEMTAITTAGGGALSSLDGGDGSTADQMLADSGGGLN